MKSLIRFFLRTSFLVAIFFSLGFLTMGMLPVFFPGGPSEAIEDIFYSIGFFFIGCAGLIMIIRREFPFFGMTLFGVIPVIIGLFFLITSWWFAINVLLESAQ